MNIGIIGLGLMGSSMAMALKKYYRDNISIYGYDNNANNLVYVIENNIIDEELNRSTYSEIDILFLAVPVRKVAEVINDILPDLNIEKTLLTDMGSTKEYICREIKERFPGLDFIGGHPMSGRELSGPTAASADLFIGMPYILCNCSINDNFKNDNTNNHNSPNYTMSRDENRFLRIKEKHKKLLDILNKIGVKTIFMDSIQHDELVAMTSHLPHCIAISTINELINQEKENPELSKIMGQGFRDFTRIAASSPEMWQDIFITNSDYIEKRIDEIIRRLLDFKEALIRQDEAELHKILSSAQEKRKSLEKEFEKVNRNGL